MSVSSILEKAGVVGCGGAGFPTHAKFTGDVEYFIVNGAECEPLLRTDRFIMRHFASSIVSAVTQISASIGAPQCVIALKESYSDEISALSKAIEDVKAPISLHLLRSFYPAGDEQIIVRETTGRVVPPGGIPLDVKTVVSNAATMLAAYDAFSDKPFIHRFLTVGGEVRDPVIVDAPIGTPLEVCLSLAGGAAIEDYCVLLGGPMMGKVISKENLASMAVTKTMSGIILLPADTRLSNIQSMGVKQMAARARAACIRCSQCTELCPRNLLGHPLEPHKIMRALALCGDVQELSLDDPVIRSAALCCECGVCELVACPMDLQPRRINAALRKMLSKAGIRYAAGAGQKPPHPFRDMRKVATVRAAARAGVYQYHKAQIDKIAEAHPDTVTISMSMHIGSPCAPLFQDGAAVTRGQLIASSPKGKLGTHIHASIAGTIKMAGGNAVISSEKG
ncbi:hypothetical protein FACS1894187_01680 [Synergistales bacterium]|nr:hypothetical protein FACS1894187_01680 [Synergistales bacterium]